MKFMCRLFFLFLVSLLMFNQKSGAVEGTTLTDRCLESWDGTPLLSQAECEACGGTYSDVSHKCYATPGEEVVVEGEAATQDDVGDMNTYNTSTGTTEHSGSGDSTSDESSTSQTKTTTTTATTDCTDETTERKSAYNACKSWLTNINGSSYDYDSECGTFATCWQSANDLEKAEQGCIDDLFCADEQEDFDTVNEQVQQIQQAYQTSYGNSDSMLTQLAGDAYKILNNYNSLLEQKSLTQGTLFDCQTNVAGMGTQIMDCRE